MCIEISDELTEICKQFDYHPEQPKGVDIKFRKKEQNGSWNIGMIVGASGSGKSTIINKFYDETKTYKWNPKKPILSQFQTCEIGIDRLNASGLSSVPSWCLPYHMLSTGEKHRADIAFNLNDNAVIDEFTSTVDRNTAKSISKSVSKYIRKNDITGVIFATCHYDIIDWVDPDWVYDASKQAFLPRGLLRQFPPISIDITPCHYSEWDAFKKHHYLTGNINVSSRCWVAWWNDVKVAFQACIPFPHGSIKNAWRSSRIVVLPEFQGLGIGAVFSDTIAQFFIDDGHRYFAKTSHPKMGNRREKSSLWKGTSENLKSRVEDYIRKTTHNKNMFSHEHLKKHAYRMCFSHEYIGKPDENFKKKTSINLFDF